MLTPLVLFLGLFSLTLSCTTSSSNSTDWTAMLYTLQSSFTDNGDGTVTDSTGVMWSKCAFGQVFNASLNNCTGTGGYTTYGAQSVSYCELDGGCYDISTLEANSGPAYNACANFSQAGYTDWKLPNRTQLAAITSGLTREDFLYIFPETPDDKYFWTSNTNTTTSAAKESYGISFATNYFGDEASFNKVSSNLYVRCIR